MAWKFIDVSCTDAAWNLALEQYVFDCLPKEHNYFMLWQNARAGIIGRHQNTLKEINESYVNGHGVQVIRRLSGGGAVYHDMGNLNFTFIQDAVSPRLDLSLFCKPVAEALQTLGAHAEVNGRNDITLEGKKISGNAQYVKNGRIMHHGTLLFDADLEAATMALTPNAEKILSKGVASVRSRMTTLKEHLPAGISLQQFKQTFLQRLFAGQDMERYELTDADIAAVDALKQVRYGTREWNYGAEPPCDLLCKGRIEGCGTVELHLRLHEGKIASAAFHGDFFGEPAELATCFVGHYPNAEGYREALANVDVSQYLKNCNNEQLLSLLLS